MHGICELFEDSLVEGKSSELGRSHGIFLMVRNRLINLDDPLLGMDAFSGFINRTRITIYADELDQNIASTREIIKESKPFSELKEYIKKKKFNNEIRKIYLKKRNKRKMRVLFRIG